MKFTRKLFFPMLLLLSFSAFAKTAVPVPEWYGNERVFYQYYPKSEYLAFRGEGKTKEEAQNDAISKLANNISVTITDRKSYEASIIETVIDEEESSSTYINSDTKTVVQSQVILYGLETSEFYYDKKAKRYYCAAYINLEDFTTKYSIQIEDAKMAFYSNYNKAIKESDALLSCSALKKSIPSGEVFLEKLSFACSINPKIEATYRKDRQTVLEIPSLIQEKIQNNSLKPVISGDYADILKVAVLEAFSSAGFIIDENNGNSVLKVVISDNAIVDGESFAVYPSVKIQIINGKGKSVYSFDKKDEKTVSFTDLNTARKKAYKKLAASLSDEIKSDLQEKIGLQEND